MKLFYFFFFHFLTTFSFNVFGCFGCQSCVYFLFGCLEKAGNEKKIQSLYFMSIVVLVAKTIKGFLFSCSGN